MADGVDQIPIWLKSACARGWNSITTAAGQAAGVECQDTQTAETLPSTEATEASSHCAPLHAVKGTCMDGSLIVADFDSSTHSTAHNTEEADNTQ